MKGEEKRSEEKRNGRKERKKWMSKEKSPKNLWGAGLPPLLFGR
jgi:hypothetical protein